MPSQDEGVTRAPDWKLWNAADVDQWPVPPLVWLVEGVIQRGGIGFLSGPPKVGKSLLALDLCHALATGTSWMGRYNCPPAKVLYIAREDPPRRIRDRLQEIRASSKDGGPWSGSLLFIIRERFIITSPEYRASLKKVIQDNGIHLVVLDVVNRMIPGIDENSAADVAKIVDAIEELNQELGVAMLAIDHTRKPQGGKKARVDPFELKGSVAKYGCCDFIICVGRQPDGDLEMFLENKDVDHSTRCLLTMSRKGCVGPKFQWKEEMAEIVADRRRQGEQNRARVRSAIGVEWLSKGEIAGKTELAPSTVGTHLKALRDDGEIECRGKNKNTKYRSSPQKNQAGNLLLSR